MLFHLDSERLVSANKTVTCQQGWPQSRAPQLGAALPAKRGAACEASPCRCWPALLPLCGVPICKHIRLCTRLPTWPANTPCLVPRALPTSKLKVIVCLVKRIQIHLQNKVFFIWSCYNLKIKCVMAIIHDIISGTNLSYTIIWLELHLILFLFCFTK